MRRVYFSDRIEFKYIYIYLTRLSINIIYFNTFIIILQRNESIQVKISLGFSSVVLQWDRFGFSIVKLGSSWAWPILSEFELGSGLSKPDPLPCLDKHSLG